MKNSRINVINALMAIILAATSCSTTPDNLTFVKEGDRYILPEKQFDSYARLIYKSAGTQEAAELLDKGYSAADSLSLLEGENHTLQTFADGIAKHFFAVDSPLKDDAIYSIALSREEECKSLDPMDFKRINWKRSLLNNNAPGRTVSNIPLMDGKGNTYHLRDLFDRTTVILLYGEQCKACEKLISSILKSKEFALMAADTAAYKLVSIYTSEDDAHFREISDKLKGWDNYKDEGLTVSYDNSFDARMVPSLYVVSSNGIVQLRGSLDVKQTADMAMKPIVETISIPLQDGERVWGGRIADGKYMPYEDAFTTTMHANSGNQVQPLLLTSKGRYVWCNEPFDFRIEGNSLILEKLTAGVETAVVGKTLSDAYVFAMRAFFPPEGTLPPDEFYEKPQYNTWIELQYNQNQEDVLKYAHGIIDHGLPPGIIMIDDTWMEDYGKWVFHPGRFPDPKKMCDELHRMGFKLMLWIVPFVSMDQYQIWAELCGSGAFLHTQTGSVYPVEWWNGVSASLDLSNPAAIEWFDRELQRLMNEYGVDGFKFDAGDFNLWPDDAVTAGNEKNYELCQDFAKFGERYPYNEFRACWKMGGKPLIQRLHDKSHNWPSLQALVPEMLAANLMGYWFSCPDMVGGGSFASFLPGCEIDQDLIVRSAQTHALMPMMQFSVAPWRILDKTHLEAVLKAAKIREELLPVIVKLVHNSAETGLPVVSPMEFRFPNQGFEDIKDQFVLGSNIIVAPMVYPGNERTVALPRGQWKADDGTVYEGGTKISINVPLDRIPYFKRVR